MALRNVILDPYNLFGFLEVLKYLVTQLAYNIYLQTIPRYSDLNAASSIEEI